MWGCKLDTELTSEQTTNCSIDTFEMYQISHITRNVISEIRSKNCRGKGGK